MKVWIFKGEGSVRIGFALSYGIKKQKKMLNIYLMYTRFEGIIQESDFTTVTVPNIM